MKRFATGVLLVFFVGFTFHLTVERTQAAFGGWSSNPHSRGTAITVQTANPKFTRIAESVFVLQPFERCEVITGIAACTFSVSTKQIPEPVLRVSRPRPPPLTLQFG